eukprot:g6210.t1
MGKNFFLSTVFLLSSGANKVLLRILLVLVSKYAFLLGVVTNCVYISVFYLQFRLSLAAAGASDDESRADSFRFALNGRGLRLLAGGERESGTGSLPTFASRAGREAEQIG